MSESEHTGLRSVARKSLSRVLRLSYPLRGSELLDDVLEGLTVTGVDTMSGRFSDEWAPLVDMRVASLLVGFTAYFLGSIAVLFGIVGAYIGLLLLLRALLPTDLAGLVVIITDLSGAVTLLVLALYYGVTSAINLYRLVRAI